MRTAPPILGRRILITGANYWPETTGIAPYTTGLAQFLASEGASVTVLTAMPSYPGWRVHDGYVGKVRMRRSESGVDVRRFRGYVPSRQSAGRRAGYELTFAAHASIHRSLGPLDAVLGIVPTLSGGLLARLEAAREHCRYGLVMQDVMALAAAQTGIPGGVAVSAVTGRVEGSVARAAAKVGIISETFRPYFEALGVGSERIVPLRNWTHVDSRTKTYEETRKTLGWPMDEQVLLHTGNMGLKQGLESIISAADLALRNGLRIRFVLMGDGGERPKLQAKAAALPNVEFHDLVPENEYPNVLHAADVLLINELATVEHMSLPSKLTSYFSSGRPVVAAVPCGGATAAEIVRSAAGIVVPPADPAALLHALERLSRDRLAADNYGKAGQDYSRRELSPEACLQRLGELTAAVVSATDQMRTRDPTRTRRRSSRLKRFQARTIQENLTTQYAHSGLVRSPVSETAFGMSGVDEQKAKS